MIETRKIRVAGKVQGVFYRVYTKEQADLIGVTGFVRNEPDGSVYIEATGTKEQLNALIEWCRKGPLKAEVSGVSSETIENKKFVGFEIRKIGLRE